MLIYRDIVERIRKVAPFLRFDADPYMVIDEGRLFWILDGYTVSDRFPYAEHFPQVGNYLRNPIKAVIDAYHGSITFYLVDPEEPIARAWNTVFPGMIRPVDELVDSLRMDVLPGNRMTIRLVKRGNEPNQAIGYLEDGTMVVVNDAGRRLNRDVKVVVTNTQQTKAGRMVFARFDGK